MPADPGALAARVRLLPGSARARFIGARLNAASDACQVGGAVTTRTRVAVSMTAAPRGTAAARQRPGDALGAKPRRGELPTR